MKLKTRLADFLATYLIREDTMNLNSKELLPGIEFIY